MNVLFVDQFSEPGGAQLCLMDLLPEVIRRGWKPRLMAPGTGSLVAWSREAGIPVDPLPLRRCSNGGKGMPDVLRYTLDLPRMAHSIRRIVRDRNIELIYINGPRVLPAVVGVPCRVIFHAHSLVAGVLARGVLAWSLRRTRAQVIAASRYVAPRRPNTRIVYNGVPDLARGSRAFEPLQPRIGIIGRIAPEKGQLDFVRAAELVTRQFPAASFFVYGESLFSAPAYSEGVRRLASNSSVTFCGWTDDVGAALHNLDILAVPSGRDEAATRVIMEAFSAGTPVIAYRSGGIPELIENGRNGLLTESSDATYLAETICFLLRDPELMRRLSSEGRSAWQRRFTISRFREEICELMSSAERTLEPCA